MTALSENTSPTLSLPRNVKNWVIGALALTVLGDWLFYDRPLGISIPLFCAVLALGAAVSNSSGLKTRRLLLVIAVLIVSLLPLLEAVTPLSLLFGIVGTAICCVLVSSEGRRDILSLLDDVALLICTGAFRLGPDALHLRRIARSKGGVIAMSVVLSWLIPLLLCGMFVLLFSIANPLIEAVLVSLNPAAWLQNFDPARAIFWAALLSIIWGCLAFSLRKPVAMRAMVHKEAMAVSVPTLTEEIVRRSLIMFNLLFAAQTVMDALYLWGSVSLPEGLSYASYAHRGAYPLIVTALLAAAFVLATMRPGSETERSPFIRWMVYLWVAQNVLLVISSILRLDLYVEVYAMTRWRLAAFIWMVLVAIGLVLIILRIARGRSNRWLLTTNGVVLTVMLYGCAFINVPQVIASYNVAHSSDGGAGDLPMDVGYLMHLGPQALPAIDHYLATTGRHDGDVSRTALAADFTYRMDDWRAWTFRDWRLQRYLAHQKATAVVAPAAEMSRDPSPDEDPSK